MPTPYRSGSPRYCKRFAHVTADGRAVDHSRSRTTLGGWLEARNIDNEAARELRRYLRCARSGNHHPSYPPRNQSISRLSWRRRAGQLLSAYADVWRHRLLSPPPRESSPHLHGLAGREIDRNQERWTHCRHSAVGTDTPLAGRLQLWRKRTWELPSPRKEVGLVRCYSNAFASPTESPRAE